MDADGRLVCMDTEPDRCPRCCWPQREPYEVVSRHATSTGTIVYTRCACGLLSTWLHPAPATTAHVIARATHPATTPGPCRR